MNLFTFIAVAFHDTGQKLFLAVIAGGISIGKVSKLQQNNNEVVNAAYLTIISSSVRSFSRFKGSSQLYLANVLPARTPTVRLAATETEDDKGRATRANMTV